MSHSLNQGGAHLFHPRQMNSNPATMTSMTAMMSATATLQAPLPATPTPLHIHSPSSGTSFQLEYSQQTQQTPQQGMSEGL